MKTDKKLLGELSFVSRTFEGRFRDNPYILDMDANLYIGPADHLGRNEHAGLEAIYQFLRQTGKIRGSVREILNNQLKLLDAFGAFDEARIEGEPPTPETQARLADAESADNADEADMGQFRILLFGTYDGDVLIPLQDDELPCGPCGKSVNELKRRFYGLCERIDPEFGQRTLSHAQLQVEAGFTLC